GAEAYRFVDWLEAAGQSWWQVLPLGPPDEFGSPYRAASAFAASPELLAEPDAPVSQAELESYVARHSYWIGEWARFAGENAIANQVRFEREWAALRAYWAVPENHRTARGGHWRRAPGAELFHTVERELGDLPVIAEDLGSITPPVYALRDELGLPGIVVLQWAFARARGNLHAPQNH